MRIRTDGIIFQFTLCKSDEFMYFKAESFTLTLSFKNVKTSFGEEKKENFTGQSR